MRIMKVNNEKMSGDEAVEIAKKDNGYRPGEYHIPWDGNHKTYYIVKYVGYSNVDGSSYGKRYEKQWKIIFNPKLYKEFCEAFWG